MTFLNPTDVRLEREANHPPTLILAGDRYMDIHIRQAFPLTSEHTYVAFFDREDQYLGLIINPDKLDEGSTRIIKDEIGWRYFSPQITEIISMEDRGGKAGFVTVTDRGKINISMKNLRESMVELSTNRILLTDEHGNRYEIPDVNQLDRHSKRLIRRLI